MSYPINTYEDRHKDGRKLEVELQGNDETYVRISCEREAREVWDGTRYPGAVVAAGLQLDHAAARELAYKILSITEEE